jgi:DNA-binding MarR family transcriptional regulator
LTASLLEAGRENSTASMLFHGAIADRAGLCPTDHKALDVLLRDGPLTAGELSLRTGLASASVTSLIDRLEAKGLVRRTRDPADRRRVIVDPVPARVDELVMLFASLRERITGLLERYDDAQLATIRDFLASSAAVLREETLRLAGKDLDPS